MLKKSGLIFLPYSTGDGTPYDTQGFRININGKVPVGSRFVLLEDYNEDSGRGSTAIMQRSGNWEVNLRVSESSSVMFRTNSELTNAREWVNQVIKSINMEYFKADRDFAYARAAMKNYKYYLDQANTHKKNAQLRYPGYKVDTPEPVVDFDQKEE